MELKTASTSEGPSPTIKENNIPSFLMCLSKDRVLCGSTSLYHLYTRLSSNYTSIHVVQSELDTCILHMNYCLIIDDGFFFLSVYSYAGACALKLCFGGVGCIDMFLSHVYVCTDVRETMRDMGKIMNKSSTNFITGLHNLQFNSDEYGYACKVSEIRIVFFQKICLEENWSILIIHIGF